MIQRYAPMTCLLSLALMVAFSGEATALAGRKEAKQAEKAKQTEKAKPPAKTRETAAGAGQHRAAAPKPRERVKHAAKERHKPKPSADVADKPQLTGDLAAIKSTIDLARKAKTDDATAIANTITDPAGRKLAEWFILRHPESSAGFTRFAAFIADNPGWPGVALMRRRAEARLWQEGSDGATVHNFTGDQPTSMKGRLALARTLLGEGDRDGAVRLARQVWRSEELSDRSESEAYDAFGDLLTREDHRARMDKRIGAKDFSGATRAAKRLGSDELSIVKACAAAMANETKGLDKLDGVEPAARQDLGYTLCRIHWMLRHDKVEEAARLTLAATPETMALQDTDEWWRDRRTLARKLLDLGKFQMAYDVIRDAALPANEYYRADFHFMTGWIALRYLNDPATARKHFAHIDEGQVNPIVLARANYWRARAAEAAGDHDAMRAGYQAASRYNTAYYGQLARAKLGLEGIELRGPLPSEPNSSPALSEEIAHAADILYSIGERDVVVSFAADLAEQCGDVATLSAFGDLTYRRNDAHAMLELGKTALGRGLAADHYAFPTVGIPEHSPIGPALERSVIYSVARTESAFDQRDKSSANAVGLMQVTPEAGRDTAKRFGVTYDWDRMVSDPVYNTQMGAAELSALLKEYNGSHIMTFAGYNAGRGRVRDWIKAYGDPRDPNVDPVDWVERIPFSETRNYVQRVMENLVVYRARFDSAGSAISKFDQPHGNAREADSAPLSSTPAQGPR